jgi:nucleotide-binding universal stress UspA family protein
MKVLICNDGSEQGERAVKLGATIAVGSQAEVTLLGIVEVEGGSADLLESLSRGQALLQQNSIRAELITKAGDPVQEIVARTRETHFDLVIVGAVRKETRGRFWMSSKTYRLIKEIAPPVLSVAGKGTTLKRVLICSGGKRYIDKAVQLTGQIARGTGATATLLHVMPDAPAIYAHMPRMEQSANWLLDSHSELGLNLRHEKETLVSSGVPTDVRLLRGPVLETILNEVRSNSYDLVVTGSALNRGLSTYVLGDISRELINRLDCAILVVRGEAGSGYVYTRFRHWFGRGAVRPKAGG